MTHTTTLGRFVSAGWLCGFLCAVTLAAQGASLTLELAGAPAPVGRGTALVYTATLANPGPLGLTNLAFRDPLPTGLDQWGAEYRIDGGPWSAYPVSGLVSLLPLPSGATRTIEVRATVEHSGPGSLSNTAQVADPTGPLAAASCVTNVLPSVDAGADKMVRLRGEIELSDAWAGDGGEAIASYAWTDHAAGGSFDDPGLLHPRYTAPGAGGLVTLMLTVTDRQGGQASDSLRVRVNSFPSVEAGRDRTVVEGGSVSLSDAAASDSDGWVVSTVWNDAGAGGTFSPSAAVPNPTYVAPPTDECGGEDVILTLTATDDWGAEALDSLTVRVTNANKSPTAEAGPDRTVSSGGETTLVGLGSDPDGGGLRFSWEHVAGPSLSVTGWDTMELRFLAPRVSAAMVLRFRLTITDVCGSSGTDEVAITVAPPAAAGAIAVSARADPTTARPGDRVTFAYTVTNSSETRLSQVVLTDSLVGEIPLSSRGLAPGERATAASVVTVREADLPGPLVSAVTATARDETGAVFTATASAGVELVLGRSSIEVSIEAEDARGFPLLPFSPLSVGDAIVYRISVRNTGETFLENLRAVEDFLGQVSLGRDRLGPWETTSGAIRRVLAEADVAGSVEGRVNVTGIDPSGRTVEASDSIVLLGASLDRGRIGLTMAASVAQAAVGDSITTTYTLANVGAVPVQELLLLDDRLGSIPLPARTLAPGESVTASATYTVLLQDLPGPLVDSAAASAADPLGRAANAEAGPVSVSLTPPSAAGGGGALEAASAPPVIISEVAWSGTPADPNGEWIELQNLATTPIDLAGWSLVWYPKGSEAPPPSLWKRVELSGTISASPIDFTRRPPGRPEITFLKRKGDEVSWQVFDMSWWSVGKKGSDGRGFYLLERKNDSTVRDVKADLVYDTQAPYRLDLPDDGAVILLLNAAGEVVDSSNADHPYRSGWPAGDQKSGATMERSDTASGGAEWHTNPGVLVYGLDSKGNRLRATAGRPNSPDLVELTLLAEKEVRPIRRDGRFEVSLGLRRSSASPWTVLSALGVAVAGGGGAQGDVALSGRSTAEGYRLAIDPSGLAAGTYYVWVSQEEGEAILVPIAVGS